jgi:AcrR family transcriptional regulator
VAATAPGAGNGRSAYHRRGEPLRAHIVEVASTLFTRDGVRAVGVNLVTAEAGISKKTLYKYFPSKDDLVVAYLSAMDQPIRDAITSAALSAGDDPRDQLLGIFDHLAREARRVDFRGCAFASTITELPPGHPARLCAAEHEAHLHAFLSETAARAAAADPGALATHLLLLYHGAAIHARIQLSASPVHAARSAAAALIELAATAPHQPQSAT